MILIGLTGTIGSGKTFALRFFKSKKIKIFSADEKVKKILENINKNENFIVMEIPIIFEQKTKKNYDYIILMDVNKKTQFERIKKRKNMTKNLFKKILANQVSDKKKKFADFVINNNGSKLKTRRILRKTLDKMLSTGL